MSNELAIRNDVITSLDDVRNVARLLAASNYFADAKGSNEAAIAQLATKVLAGREMGFAPFASVNGIHVIQGKPTVSANLMAAAVKASGRYDYRVRQMDDSAVSIEFFERAGGKLESLGVSTFTADDAKKAGTQNMAKFARNMLFARAMSNGVRWYTPDVFSGNSVYTPDELGADVDDNGDVIDVTPAPQLAAKPAPVAQPEPDTNKAAALLRQAHAIGAEVYGAEWDAVRHSMCLDLTAGQRESSKDLTPGELEQMVRALSTVQIAKRTQGDAWQGVVTKVEEKFNLPWLDWSNEQHEQARVWFNKKSAVAA